MSGLPVFFVVLALIAVFVIFIFFNPLVALKHAAGNAWSNIDILLKQRHDESPKLVETGRQYMKFERETLEEFMRARGQVGSARASHDIRAPGQAEGALRLGLGQLFCRGRSLP